MIIMLKVNNPYLTLTTLISEFQKKVLGGSVTSSQVAFERFQINLRKIYPNIIGGSDAELFSPERIQHYRRLSYLSPDLFAAIETIIFEYREDGSRTLRSSPEDPHVIEDQLLQLKNQCQTLEQKLERARTSFGEINQRLGSYFDNPTSKMIELFADLSERCYSVRVLLEDMQEADNMTSSDECAYKLMVLFLPHKDEREPQKDLNIIAAKADKYFRRVDVAVTRPLYELLFIKPLPLRADVADFDGWLSLIESYGVKAMNYFPQALKIEEKNEKRAPKSLEEARQIWAQSLYSRSSEDLEFAQLCHKYNVREEDFSQALDYLASPLKENSRIGWVKNPIERDNIPNILNTGADVARGNPWPKKPIDSDNIPSILIEGTDEARGYYWVKLPSDDKRGLIIGNITNCCQHIGGIEDSCVRDACELPDNGVYVLLKAQNKTASRYTLFTNGNHINYENFKIIAQSYVWRSVNGNLCLDSIEYLRGQISFSALKAITTELAREIIASYPEIGLVSVGAGGRTPWNFGEPISPELIKTGEQRIDSLKQYLIAKRPNGAQYKKHAETWSFIGKVDIPAPITELSERISLTSSAPDYHDKIREVLQALSEQQQIVLEYCSCYMPEYLHPELIEVLYKLPSDFKILYLENLENCIKIFRLQITDWEQLEPIFSPITQEKLENLSKSLGAYTASDAKKSVVPILLGDCSLPQKVQILISTKTSSELDNILYRLLINSRTNKTCKEFYHAIITEMFRHITKQTKAYETVLDHHIKISDSILVNTIMTKNKNQLEIMIAKFGIDVNKKINILDLPNNIGLGATPILLSFLAGSPEISSLLIQQGADGHQLDDCGQGVVYYAVKSGDSDCIDYLLNPEKFSEKTGAPSFLQVYKDTHMQNVRDRIRTGGDLNEKNKDGETLFLLSCGLGHKEAIEVLLAHHADIYQKGPDGKTALTLVLRNPHADIHIVNLLLQDQFFIDEKENSGRTALMISALFQKNQDITRLVLERSPSIDLQSHTGDTALMLAVSNNCEAVKLLLEKGANHTITNKNGETALFIACASGRADIVRILLEKGANPNITTTGGDTPLLKACALGYSDIVRMLIEKNADIEYMNTFNETAVDIAEKRGYFEISKILAEKQSELLASRQGSPIVLSAGKKEHLGDNTLAPDI